MLLLEGARFLYGLGGLKDGVEDWEERLRDAGGGRLDERRASYLDRAWRTARTVMHRAAAEAPAGLVRRANHHRTAAAVGMHRVPAPATAHGPLPDICTLSLFGRTRLDLVRDTTRHGVIFDAPVDCAAVLLVLRRTAYGSSRRHVRAGAHR